MVDAPQICTNWSGLIFAHKTYRATSSGVVADDGGAFVTLPQVLSMGTETSLMKANLGMYRIQLSGNEFQPDHQVGLHYQLHRGIGVHHQACLNANKPFHVAISVGGSPAMTLSAVMPLPEGLSELPLPVPWRAIGFR